MPPYSNQAWCSDTPCNPRTQKSFIYSQIYGENPYNRPLQKPILRIACRAWYLWTGLVVVASPPAWKPRLHCWCCSVRAARRASSTAAGLTVGLRCVVGYGSQDRGGGGRGSIPPPGSLRRNIDIKIWMIWSDYIFNVTKCLQQIEILVLLHMSP